ncbi:hypothetical protein EF847_10340 [Actinobacteria bacterium YIM 96077]|uniref:Type II toxin-antitoxin system VapB family antitoxin n=1 Tax=Phytoactinopolyspora halophila TaxID=1981511 RepID=A0A329QBB2_9ACTN|nr:type II toxin-antitoxin system VapB family antitoxin [Phytoactinopolyspora halophila]AYY13039.1 hypothetical protein EF847_10340 [Actinobacteria bacterium YIM 96077]RAW09700.1 hypothetical protein DPM12_20285 [Phytoactinopolyspora halophila]
MSKRLVDIDDETLRQAQQVLGTVTIKETVNAALMGTIQSSSRQAVSRESLRRFSEAARDLKDSSVMAQAWE